MYNYHANSLRIKMQFDDQLSVNDQAIAFCIAEEYRGMMCGTASTGDDTQASEYRSYWFSDLSIIDIIKDDDPLDLWDSAYDDYMIDDYFFGITQFFIRMASANSVVGDKFQYREVTNEVQWNNVDDYRFKAGDTISLYRLQQQTDGTLIWNWTEDRTLLSGASVITSLIATSIASIACMLAF